MNKLLLKIVMLFSGLWRRLGADTEQLKAILHVKLIMDDRKPLSFGGNKGVERKRKKNKKPRKNTSFMTALLSFFMGFIYVLPIVIAPKQPVIALSLFYTFFIFFFTFTLITDFANVLVDTKDKQIIFPRPVNDSTIMLSRLLYIAIYLFRLAVPMSLPAWILFGIFKGWLGVLWFPFSILLIVFIVLFIVCAFYLTVLKLAKPGKFKEVLNYFQIAFSIVFFATYMLSSRMIDPDALAELKIQTFEWAKYIPSYWLAAAWTWFEPTADVIKGTRWLGVLAIVAPIVSLWATVKFLAPSFIKSLVLSDNVNDTSSKKNDKEVKSKKLVYTLANKLNRNDISKAGFIMTWIQTGRSRTFKMRVYPTFAYVPVYFFYLLMMDRQPFADVWASLPERNNYVMLLYMTTFVIMQGLAYITMSEGYKASWIYYASPIEKPGEIIVGAFKAMWVKFFLPFMIVIGGFTIYVWGPERIVDVILATINITLFTVMQMYFGYRMLPFSMREQVKDSASKTILRVLLVFLLIGALGTGHYFVGFTIWPNVFKVIFMVLSSVLLWMFFDSLKNTPWEKLKTAED